MIPERAQKAIDRYVQEHEPPSGFFHAVLANKLKEAVLRADEENRAALADILLYCYFDIPAECWGSPGIVDKWLRMEAEPQEPVR